MKSQASLQTSLLVAGLMFCIAGCQIKPEGKHGDYRGAIMLAAPPSKVVPVANEQNAAVVTVTPEAGATISVANVESTNSAFKETVVTVPPGTLAFATSVTVLEATPVVNAASTSALGIQGAQPSGPAVAVEVGDESALVGTIGLSLPYDPSAGLTGARQYFVVGLYKAKSGSGFNVETFLGSELTFEAKKITINIAHSGAYQVSSAPAEQIIVKKVESTNVGYIAAKLATDMGVGNHTTFYINTLAELPECNAGRISNLYYTVETKTFHACDGSAWTVVGLKGDRGDTGARGDAGKNGERGDAGRNGERGDKGDQGIAGSQGAQGSQGAAGADGLAGPVGPQGVDGAQGATGAAGVNATLGERLVIAGTDTTFAYFKGVGTRIWAEFTAGFTTPLELDGTSYKPRRKDVYYGERNCGGDRFIGSNEFYEASRIVYTGIDATPLVITSAQAPLKDALSIWRPGDSGCHNLEGVVEMYPDGVPGRSGPSGPENFVNIGQYVFYVAPGVNDASLFRFDRVTGTVITYWNGPNDTGAFGYRLAALPPSTLVISVMNELTMVPELWRSNINTPPTSKLFDISKEPIATLGSDVYFMKQGLTEGIELFKIGATGSESLVQDYNPIGDTDVNDVFVIGNQLILRVNGAPGTDTYLVTDGTTLTPMSVITGNPNLYGGMNHGTLADGTALFRSYDPLLGGELFSLSGSNFDLVSDINPSTGSSEPSNFVSFDGAVFFTAADGSSHTELYVHDGSTTSPVTSFATSGVDITGLAVVGTRLYFFKEISHQTKRLLFIDTSGPSYTVSDTQLEFRADSGVMNLPEGIVAVNGKAAFVAARPDDTPKFWTSDGTVQGSVAVEGFAADIGGMGYSLFSCGDVVCLTPQGRLYIYFEGDNSTTDRDVYGRPDHYLSTDVINYSPLSNGTLLQKL